jgi:hypothetical protein
MNTKTTRSVLRGIITVCGLTIVPVLIAQSWDEVRSLKPGDHVKVRDATGEEQKGELRAVSPETITISDGGVERTIARTSIRRVQVRSGSRRVRNALIGAAIGVAVAVTVDQTLGAYLRNESNTSGRGIIYAAPIGLGSGIGAALPAYRTVYRVR